jgi:outer membrane protein assembly factor BamB
LKQYMQERCPPFVLFLVALGALTLLTSCSGGTPAFSWFGIAASDDTVYLAANEQVLALNLESGAELWAFPSAPDRETGPFYATPLLTNDTLIVGGFNDGKLYAVPRNGETQEWAVEIEGAIVEGAVSTDGGVVVGNGRGEVYWVDIETQEKRTLLEADDPVWATPLVDEVNGRAYVTSMDHHLYAVELEGGGQPWEPFEAGGAIAGTPALSNGVLYFGALNNSFYAIDAETGVELWRFETEGWVWGGPLVHKGSVYFGDLAGKLYALNATDGSERWTFEAEGGVRVTPLLMTLELADDLLYFGTREGKVYAIKADDGAQKWMLPLAGAIYSQPVVSGDYLLVSPHNAKVQLVALDLESGAERWSYPLREE